MFKFEFKEYAPVLALGAIVCFILSILGTHPLDSKIPLEPWMRFALGMLGIICICIIFATSRTASSQTDNVSVKDSELNDSLAGKQTKIAITATQNDPIEEVQNGQGSQAQDVKQLLALSSTSDYGSNLSPVSTIENIRKKIDYYFLDESYQERQGRKGAPLTTLISGAAFEAIGPAYILNAKDYSFLDWNPAFELVFPTDHFRRGDIVDRWISCLDNSKEVQERGKKLFDYGKTPPTADHELLIYSSSTYGRIVFTKNAFQILSPRSGKLVEWIVTLNINSLENTDGYIADLDNVIQEHQHWRVYSTAYDPILTVFEPYIQMVKQHADAVAGSGKRILDLGAGTGNLALELLKNGKEVFALDYNDAMLAQLRNKCGEYKSNLHIIKQNIETFQVSPRNAEIGKYDGITMLNVLFTLRNPIRCLEKCYQALAPGGVLVFSGPKKGIALDTLLVLMLEYLRKHGLWESLRDQFEVVRQRNDFMKDSRILQQYWPDEVSTMLEKIGFKIRRINTEAYLGDDMIVEAHKY